MKTKRQNKKDEKVFTNFDNNSIVKARDLIQSKLDELKNFGLNIEIGRIGYQSSSFSAKIQCVIPESGEEEYSAKTLAFKNNLHSYSKIYDVSPKMFGKRAVFEGEKFMFVGINPRKRGRNFVFESLDRKGTYLNTNKEYFKTLLNAK